MTSPRLNDPAQSTIVFAPSGVLLEPAAARRAIAHLSSLGFDARLDEAALSRFQRFAGDDDARLAAIHRVAEAAPSVALALRGGYGLTRLLDRIDWRLIRRSLAQGTRWVGYSDFTAFHLAALAHGAMLVKKAGKGERKKPKDHQHSNTGRLWCGPLAHDDFSRTPDRGGIDDITEACFVEAMDGSLEAIGFRTEPGFDGLRCKGTLWGGNLTVLLAMLGTPHWPRIDKGILFLEDVNERTYRTERNLLQLHQAGVLDAQKAIVLGAFSDVPTSPMDRGYTFKKAIDYIRSLTRTPILTGLPFGHVPTKVCLPIGERASLSVAGRDVLLGWGA